MRMSRLFTKTLRQDPAEAETASHRLMLKSGMITQLAAGIYTYLPLAQRSLRKIERIIREEMDLVGGQEIRMPALHPLSVWQSAQRDAAFGDNLFHVSDRRKRPLVLAPTHEEVVTNLMKAQVHSYRDLPVLVYQIQTKFRDEPRPRAGLVRVREFDMKDAYSFHSTEEDLDLLYHQMVKAYKTIFERCGLPTLSVEADSGAIGGKESHEFILPAESGEDFVLVCPAQDYSANSEQAKCLPAPLKNEAKQPLEEIVTPGAKTIASLAEFTGVPINKTLKVVFYTADSELVVITLRGDLAVNEVKLKNLLKVNELRLATDEEVRRAGLIAGFASPIGLKNIKRVGDLSIQSGSNFVIGANKPDTHLMNANYPRDFEIDLLSDIALAEPGHECPNCGKPLEGIQGIEVGHVFKLGTFFSNALGALYLTEEGQQQPIIMGCYGIGLGRLLAAAVEQNHDSHGIVFPLPIAPYQLHLIGIHLDTPDVARAAETIYTRLKENGYEVLYDDRAESPGVKLKDADLIGLPVRLVMSPRTLENQSLEIKSRRDAHASVIPLDDLDVALKTLLKSSL